MTTGIVDTTVIIHLFRRNADARAWLQAQTTQHFVTPFTWLEVMYGAPSKTTQAQCKALLDLFVLEYPIRADMDWAMQQMEKIRPAQAISTNDCLIASVCHRLQLPLYTHNLKHMRALLDPALVIQPY